MGFHRLAVPSYTGGLPGGYDYINNATSGTPALANGALASGPNSGSYFVGFGDDGSSANVNRPIHALAENCDYLDNLLRRDIAVRVKTSVVTSGGTVSSISVSGAGQYFGEGGTPNTAAGIATFCEVVDSDGNPILVSGAQVRVTTITGATPGDGFVATTPIVYNLTPSIGTGVSYQLIYSKRGNLATFPVDQLSQLRSRTPLASVVAYAGGSAWADGTTNPATTVEAQLDKIVSDLTALAGASRITSDEIGTWADGDTLDGGTIQAQLTQIVTKLSAAGGAAKLGFAGSSSWADGTTNPATTVEAQFDKVVSDLRGAGGSEKVGAQLRTGAAAYDIAAGTVGSQIVELLAIVGDIAAYRTVFFDHASAAPATLTNTFADIKSFASFSVKAGDLIEVHAHMQLDAAASSAVNTYHHWLFVHTPSGTTTLPATDAYEGKTNNGASVQFGGAYTHQVYTVPLDGTLIVKLQAKDTTSSTVCTLMRASVRQIRPSGGAS
jgi:hypothetical protein